MISVIGIWVIALFVAVLCIYSIKELHHSAGRLGSLELIGFFVFACIWIVSLTFEMSVESTHALHGDALRLSLVGEAFMSPFLFLFTYRYLIGRDVSLIQRFFVLIIPTLTAGLILTNPNHMFVWSDFKEVTLFSISHTRPIPGTWGLVHEVFDYGFYIVSALTFLWVSVKTNLYTKQLLVVASAIFLSVLANSLYTIGAVPIQITPSGLAASGLVFVYGLRNTNLYTASPGVRVFGWKSFTETVSSGLIMTGPNSHVVDSNTTAEDMFGFSTTDIVGKKITAVIPKETEEESYPYEVETDSGCVYRIMKKKLKNGSEAQVGYTYTIDEVTDERQRQEQLRVINRTLRHNLRNKLSILSVQFNILKKEMDTERHLDSFDEKFESIETILSSLNSMSQDAETLQSLVDTGAETTTIPVSEIEVAIEESLSDEYPTSQISTQIPPSAIVECVPHFKDAVEHIIQNSFEHNSDNVSVTVNAECAADTVTITVTDDGSGIPEYELSAFRSKMETKLNHCSGLGLWIADWATRCSGGNMKISSSSDGTVVAFTLPRGEIPEYNN